MRLPDRLQNRCFTEWNYVVRGVVEIWEMARLLGLEQELEQLLARDEECELVELLAKIGF